MPEHANARRQPRLLIVEDEPDLRTLIEFAAKRSGVFSTICSADDGRTALDLIGAGLRGENPEMPPDVVFTDRNMPRVNGLQLAQTLRGMPELQHVPVALFTSACSALECAQAREAGCTAHFSKPVGLWGLIAIMRDVASLCAGDHLVIARTQGTPPPFAPAA